MNNSVYAGCRYNRNAASLIAGRSSSETRGSHNYICSANIKLYATHILNYELVFADFRRAHARLDVNADIDISKMLRGLLTQKAIRWQRRERAESARARF